MLFSFLNAMMTTIYAFYDTHHLEPVTNHNTYIPHRSEQLIVDSLKDSCDLFVHWGVFECGKTIASRNAAQRLQDEHGRLVVFKKGYDCIVGRGGDLYRKLGLPSSSPEKPFSSFLRDGERPATLILDHFDDFVWRDIRDSEEACRAFVDLVWDARSSRKFNLMVVVTSWEQAQEIIRLTGARLIGDNPESARWTAAELLALYHTAQRRQDPTAMRRSKKEYDEVLNLAIKGGSPGLLMYGLTDMESIKASGRRAKLYKNEWTNGILALSGGTPNGKGAFPDRNGVFHWS